MQIKQNTRHPCTITINEGIILKNELPDGFVITDSNLAAKYGDLIGEHPHYVMKAGEASKSLRTYELVHRELEHFRGRAIGFGGGVVTDVAGLAAGELVLDLVLVPTSLTAMVDAAIGGKNGINRDGIKNAIRKMHQPSEVITDTLFLQTLPIKEFKNGIAEVIKYHDIFNSPAREIILPEVINKNLEKIICNCILNKVKIVEQDEEDKGIRHCLNFGHTFGHAFELLYNLNHGEAISIGMAYEDVLGKKLGYRKENNLKYLLKSHGLPLNLPCNIDMDKVIEIMKHDKKGAFVFAFSRDNYNIQLDERTIREFLASSTILKNKIPPPVPEN